MMSIVNFSNNKKNEKNAGINGLSLGKHLKKHWNVISLGKLLFC